MVYIEPHLSPHQNLNVHTHTQSIQWLNLKNVMRPWKSCDHQKIFSLLYILFFLLVVGTRTPLKKTKKGEILCDFSKLINIFHVPTGPYYLLECLTLPCSSHTPCWHIMHIYIYFYLTHTHAKEQLDKDKNWSTTGFKLFNYYYFSMCWCQLNDSVFVVFTWVSFTHEISARIELLVS